MFDDSVIQEHKRSIIQQKIAAKYAPTSGPGTELKSLLKKIGITSSTTCACNSRALHMDKMGCDWCAENIEQICDWLNEEADRRKLPFFRLGAKVLVKRAISNARKKGQ